MSSPEDKVLSEITRAVMDQLCFANNIISRSSPNEPHMLWHYTTADGLVGIVNNQELFMSHILCMNDTEEYRHGIAHVIRACGIRNDSNVSESAKKFHEALTPRLVNNIIKVPDIFVSCFSEKTDTHIHWLEYGRNGVGYAIGFDTARLKAITSNYCAFRACVYQDHVKEQIAVETLASADRALDTIIASHNDIPKDRIIEEFAQGFSGVVGAYLGLIFKNSIFEPEREWRLLTTLGGTQALESSFDARGNEVREIVKLPISYGDGTTSPIAEIKIGSNRDERLRDIAKAVIDRLLAKNRRSSWNVNVSVSRSPYRSS